MRVGMWESQQRFPRTVGRVEIRMLDFQAFHRPAFPRALQYTSSSSRRREGNTQRAVKLVPEGVQKTDRHRPVQDFKVTLIERSQAHPLVSENLAQEGTYAVHLQTALLGNTAHHDIVAVVQFRHPAGHLSGRSGVAIGRRSIIQRRMRTLVVYSCWKRSKAAC